MGLTLSDTELMERMGDELKEWAKKPDDALFPNTTHLPENKAFSEASYHVTDIEALKPFNRVMECLRFYKPSVAKSVQNKYDIFMSGAYEVHQLINAGRKDPLHVSILRRAAVVLADELQHTARKAREELKSKERAKSSTIGGILKVIFYVISGLAALLAIFYYLGWLAPIKTFIENILRGE